MLAAGTIGAAASPGSPPPDDSAAVRPLAPVVTVSLSARRWGVWERRSPAQGCDWAARKTTAGGPSLSLESDASSAARATASGRGMRLTTKPPAEHTQRRGSTSKHGHGASPLCADVGGKGGSAPPPWGQGDGCRSVLRRPASAARRPLAGAARAAPALQQPLSAPYVRPRPLLLDVHLFTWHLVCTQGP